MMGLYEVVPGAVMGVALMQVKQAYGEKEHRGLAGVTSNTAGMAGGARELVQAGALEADQGIRHPWLPHTDQGHAFAGSQSRAMVGRNVRSSLEAARNDVVQSIAGNYRGGMSGMMSGAQGVRGLKAFGEANHRMADISAHYDKPLTQGIDSQLRTVLPESGYGGGLVGGREHYNSGLKMQGGGLAAELDTFRPSVDAHDAQALRRSQAMGRAFRRQVTNDLINHGHIPAEHAPAAVERFFTQFNPGMVSKTVGEVSRDGRYVAHEAGRAAGAIRGAVGRLGGLIFRR
jgi:hypothetical protein